MKIVIIDGQGGKMGSLLIETLRQSPLFGQSESGKNPPSLVAIGTNSIATAAMLRAGATAGATGENPVLVNCRDAAVIVGPIGILAADSLLGEITPAMAAAIGQSPAQKVLLPVNKCNHYVAGVQEMPLQKLIQDAVRFIVNYLNPPESSSESIHDCHP